MRKSIKLSIGLLVAALALPSAANAYKYDYKTVENDPMKTLFYTLPNGLTVVMSVNKDQPRIQTNIAVKVGSKNDPPETTGLAHYFEHMMFKGTKDFGTSDYEAEKPLLDKIEELFEVYRVTTDSTERAQLYHQIDSISFEASKIAIPNEYDKLMASIGANGTNAYTSYDMTCYVEDIPSNELERWAQIQANRFEFPVLRGFHTELETIYEEKNMSLTKDNRKMSEGMMAALFPEHPYGQWAVLGSQQHLKNPSITNIKNYHKQWYVPNNIAILMSGDFDPDHAVDVITKYFGHLQPNPNLPKLPDTPATVINGPIKKEVWGNEAEALILAWSFPGAADPSIETLDIVDALLSNGQAGLIDLNINQAQKALGVGSGMWNLADRTAYLVQGSPKEGQTLEELQALILEQIAMLRSGDFDDELIPATINNYKLSQQRIIETNDGRVNVMEDIFINGFDPQSYATRLDRQSKLTKADIVDFANKYLRDDNFVAIYKRQGKDTTELKIAKQPITPIMVNRDISSDYLKKVVEERVEPIEPVFVDFNRDLTFTSAKKGQIPVLYKKNESNDLFQLTYVYDFGTDSDKELSMLGKYFPLLGTGKMSPEEIAMQFYSLACDYSLNIGSDRSYVVISGLSENMPQAIKLVETIMKEAKPDQEVYNDVVDRLIKSREDAKSNQSRNFNALRSYVNYGPDQLRDRTITNEQMKNVSPKSLTDRLAKLNNYEHKIIYYGPMEEAELIKVIDSEHKTPKKLAKAPEGTKIYPIVPTETVFYIAPYDAKQLYMSEIATDSAKFNPANEPLRVMFNEYFGGGMNSIVFQEMREARSLAYSAWASRTKPSRLYLPYQFMAGIATQNDKLDDALTGFEGIIEEMPVSEAAFNLAKTGLESRLRTERIIKDDIAWLWINNQNLGIEGDSRKDLFEALPSISLDDIIKYHVDNVKGRVYRVAILGDPNDLDLDVLRSRGKVVMVTTDEIFGY